MVYGLGFETALLLETILKSRTWISDTNTMAYNLWSLPFGSLALAGKCLVNEFWRLHLISNASGEFRVKYRYYCRNILKKMSSVCRHILSNLVELIARTFSFVE